MIGQDKRRIQFEGSQINGKYAKQALITCQYCSSSSDIVSMQKAMRQNYDKKKEAGKKEKKRSDKEGNEYQKGWRDIDSVM